MGTGTGAGTGVETPGGIVEMGMGTSMGTRTGTVIGSSRAEERRREAKKRKKSHKTCKRHLRNGGDLGEKRKKHRKERVGPVAANPDNLGSNKEAGGGAQGT